MSIRTLRVLGCLLFLITTLPAQSPRTLQLLGRQRLPSGAVARLDAQRLIPRGAEVTIQTTPPLDPPPALAWDEEQSHLTLGLPTGTPPGEYELQLQWTNSTGRLTTRTFTLAVDELPRLAEGDRPPVVLLNGLQLSLFGGCPVANGRPPSSGTFGNLQTLLESSGAQVLFFDNCKECPGCSLERLGAQLGRFLRAWKLDDGSPIPNYDLIAHSMGGLIVRAYLSGKQETAAAFDPPAETKVRKLVTLGTPHFGSYKSIAIGRQTTQLRSGSRFLFDLATWNLGADNLRNVDALAVAGNACGYYDLPHAGDGLVALSSASLAFARPNERTRIVPYQHTSFTLFSSCDGKGDIAKINNADHDSWRIIESFLADTPDWQTIGTTPVEDPYLSQAAGLLLALQDRNGVFFNNLRNARLDDTDNLSGGPTLFYTDYLESGPHTLEFAGPNGRAATTFELTPGSTAAIAFKFGPRINALRYDNALILTGNELQAAAVQLDGQSLEVTSATGDEVIAVLPALSPGYHKLTVTTPAGQHTVGFQLD